MLQLVASATGIAPVAPTHTKSQPKPFIIRTLRASAEPSTSRGFRRAFDTVIPHWQEARHHTGSGLQVLAYHNETGAGDATYTRNSARIRVCISDFVADVELNARRALNPEELRYFLCYYKEDDGQIDEVDEEDAALDARVRMKLGKRLIYAGVFPLAEYFRPVDVRNRKKEGAVSIQACAEESNVIDISASAGWRGQGEGSVDISAATSDEDKPLPRPLLYDRKTVAHLLSISTRSVAYLIESGELPIRRIGGRVLHPASAVHRLADKGTGVIRERAPKESAA